MTDKYFIVAQGKPDCSAIGSVIHRTRWRCRKCGAERAVAWRRRRAAAA